VTKNLNIAENDRVHHIQSAAVKLPRGDGDTSGTQSKGEWSSCEAVETLNGKLGKRDTSVCTTTKKTGSY